MKNTDTVFCICIEHDNETRNRNLGFTCARFVTVPDPLLIIRIIFCKCPSN